MSLLQQTREERDALVSVRAQVVQLQEQLELSTRRQEELARELAKVQ